LKELEQQYAMEKAATERQFEKQRQVSLYMYQHTHTHTHRQTDRQRYRLRREAITDCVSHRHSLASRHCFIETVTCNWPLIR